MERDLTAQEELLARRMAERDRVATERTASEEAYSAIETRVNQVRGGLGYRSERLRIVDPGIVPEQPSAPNLPLRVLAALLLGLVVPVVFLTLELSYRTQRASSKWTADV